VVKPKGQVTGFQTVALPSYIRKKREKELAGKENFFDEAIKSMKDKE